MQGSGYRRNSHINKRPCSACIQAALLSEELGRPLNLYVVIELRHTSITVDSASHVFEQIRSGHFVRWFARKRPSCRPMFIWTVETAAGGSHINWIVHIPQDLQTEFGKKLERWFKRATGEAHVPPGAIDIQPVGARAVWGSGLMPLVRYI